MLKVRTEACLGCGLCARSCAPGAIHIIGGKALIDQPRCTLCYRCVDVCPQGAILLSAETVAPQRGENTPLRWQAHRAEERRELRALKDRVDNLMRELSRISGRIDGLRGKG